MKPDAHTRTVQARFTRSAPTYDSYAELQRSVAVKLQSLIPRTGEPSPILEIGCGTGQLTRLLCALWPNARITALDLAETMLHQARLVHSDGFNVTWLHADIMGFRADHRFALIASNCAMHWIHPFHAGIQHIASLLTPGGCLAAAIMQAGTLAELREARLKAAPQKPPMGRLPTQVEIHAALKDAGLTLKHTHQEIRMMGCSSATELLHILHAQGLTGGLVSRAAAPLGRKELQRLVEYYDRHNTVADGSVRASYCVGYYIATKAKAGSAPS